MEANTPIQRLTRGSDLEVYAIDLNLALPNHGIPQGWSYVDSPDWGVSGMIGYREPSASGIHPNSLSIAYSVTGFDSDRFPVEVFDDHEAEMCILGGSVIEAHSTVNAPGDGLVASCSGTYVENAEVLFLEYRYYVYHDVLRSPVSWIVEIVDTCPYHMRTTTMTVDYRQIRKIWEDTLDELLVVGYQQPASSEQAGSASPGKQQSVVLPLDVRLTDGVATAGAGEKAVELPRDRRTERSQISREP